MAGQPARAGGAAVSGQDDMSPTKRLQEIRLLAAWLDLHRFESTGSEWRANASDLARHVQHLDTWLIGGGSRPKDWKRRK